MSFWIWSWVLVLVAGGRGGGSHFRYTHGVLILSIVQRTPVVVSEDHSLSVSRAGWAALFPASPLPLVPPTLRLRCYDASALGASLRPFFRDGESDVFAVLQGGLTGSLGSSWSDGSLYMATAWRQTEAVSATDLKKTSGLFRRHWGDQPSITLGRKCAAPLFFFTLLPFMIWPSRLIPMYQQRPDCVWR